MRTTQERMDEIQKRSEDLIRKQKKRRTLLMGTCIPMILTLVLVGGWFLYPNSPTETEAIPYEGETLPEIMEDEMEAVEEGMTIPAIMVETATAPLGSYTDYEGITLELLSLDRNENGLSLTIKWKNGTDKEAIYGSAFYIDRFQGGTWIPCNMNENLCFTAIAYILEPNSEREETYHLTGVYDLPDTGTFRFRTDAFVYTTPDESTPCTLWTTFQIES